MPQMAPLNWLSLFILFTMIFLMFCTLNYFSFMASPPTPHKNNSQSKMPMYWKW